MTTPSTREPIIFSEQDQGEVLFPHDDPLVISAVVAKSLVARILVDNGSSMNLMYWNYFQKMNIISDRLLPVKTPFYNFTGEAVQVMGSIQLPVTLGKEPLFVMRQVNFMIVQSTSSAYTIIFG